jgi:hypothetical protein
MQYLELVVVLVLVEVILFGFTLLKCPELVVVLVLCEVILFRLPLYCRVRSSCPRGPWDPPSVLQGPGVLPQGPVGPPWGSRWGAGTCREIS